MNIRMNGLGESVKAAPKEQLPFSLRYKGLDRDEIWKALRRTDGATGGFFSGNLSGFHEQRRDSICRALFFCPAEVL